MPGWQETKGEEKKQPRPRPQYNAEVADRMVHFGSGGADKCAWRLGKGWTMRKLIERKG